MQKKRIQKLITFSPQLATHIEEKAKRIGVSFPEYIRGLAVEDIKENPADYIVASAEVEKQIGASLKEFEEDKSVEMDANNSTHMKDLFEG